MAAFQPGAFEIGVFEVATYSYTTDAAEDKGVAFKLAQVNAQRAEQGQGAITATQLMNGLLKDTLAGWTGQARSDEAARLERAYKAADAATQTQVKTLLGVS
jgi:hypothetical protein